MTSAKLKNCLVLDPELKENPCDELELASLGLVINYIDVLSDAETIFKEQKETIGLVISDSSRSNETTTEVLNKILKFNSYHKLEIPIIFVNSNMDLSLIHI